MWRVAARSGCVYITCTCRPCEAAALGRRRSPLCCSPPGAACVEGVGRGGQGGAALQGSHDASHRPASLLRLTRSAAAAWTPWTRVGSTAPRLGSTRDAPRTRRCPPMRGAWAGRGRVRRLGCMPWRVGVEQGALVGDLVGELVDYLIHPHALVHSAAPASAAPSASPAAAAPWLAPAGWPPLVTG